MLLKFFPKSFAPPNGHFSIVNEKNRKFGILAKVDIFTKVLFLLRFGVTFVVFIQRIVKKLFHFEVMFR